MPSGSYKAQHDVQCPFFKFDDGKQKRIVCEGIIDECSLALIYRRKRDYLKQLDAFCCERYKYCEIYQILMKAKYDEED